MHVDQMKMQKHIYLGQKTGWTHKFLDHVKVQRLCLTLVGEARLWYESHRPINVDWVGLQNIFSQQYSKIGNTREQLFQAWRSFHFDKNAEMIHVYVNHIRHVSCFFPCVTFFCSQKVMLHPYIYIYRSLLLGF